MAHPMDKGHVETSILMARELDPLPRDQATRIQKLEKRNHLF
jgi:hypothetical protein